MANPAPETAGYPRTSGGLVIKENAYNSGGFLVLDLQSHKSGFANRDLVDLLLLSDGLMNTLEIERKLASKYGEPDTGIGTRVRESLDYLQRMGYVDIAEEPSYRPIVYHERQFEWSLDVVYLEVTNSCNLSCLYCYADADLQQPSRLEVAELLPLVDDLASLGVLKIVVTGGEPLLHESLFEVLQHVRDNRIDFSLFTNGTLLNEENVMRLRALNPQAVSLSLDSNRRRTNDALRGKGSFVRAVRGVELLTNARIPTRINCTLVQGINDSLEAVENAVGFFETLGVRSTAVGPVMRYGRAQRHKELTSDSSMSLEIASTLRRAAERHRRWHRSEPPPSLRFSDDLDSGAMAHYSTCGIGTSACCITARGDVVLCPTLRGEEHRAGNVLGDDLGRIWAEAKVFEPFRNCTIEDIRPCRSCPSKASCLGGCRARALLHSGDFRSPDPLRCNMLRADGSRRAPG